MSMGDAKMLRSVTGLAATLAFVAVAAAQDIPGLQRVIERLSSPPTSEELAGLGASNPNAYIFFLQDFLKDKGSYAGPLSGQLTSATIGAIVSFCRETGFAETCARGPMLPQSIAAVSNAVVAALTPVAEAAATPEPAPEPAVAEAAEAPVLPEGWLLNDNGGRGSLGLEVEIVSAGAAEAVIRFEGTATRRGYFGVNFEPARAIAPGKWVTTVSATRDEVPETEGVIRLRTAKQGEKGYQGELFDGIVIKPGPDLVKMSGGGVATGDTLRLLPYVQLWVEAGDRVDFTLRLANPSMVAAE